jgi:Fur family ferric uptake transcriptional regulator
MSRAKPADSSDNVRELIRATGARATRGRVRVLEMLQAAARPLSHAEVEAGLTDAADAPPDRVTLYRILDSLVEGGLALKAVDTRGVFRFSGVQARRQHAGHVHFRCTECGGVFCLAAAPPPPPRLPRGFRLRHAEFDVSGTCPECVHREAAG